MKALLEFEIVDRVGKVLLLKNEANQYFYTTENMLYKSMPKEKAPTLFYRVLYKSKYDNVFISDDYFSSEESFKEKFPHHIFLKFIEETATINADTEGVCK